MCVSITISLYFRFFSPEERFVLPAKQNRIEFSRSRQRVFFFFQFYISFSGGIALCGVIKEKKVLNRILSNRREKKVFSSLQTITAREDIFFSFVRVVKRPRKTDVRRSDGGTVTRTGYIGRVKRCSLCAVKKREEKKQKKITNRAFNRNSLRWREENCLMIF